MKEIEFNYRIYNNNNGEIISSENCDIKLSQDSIYRVYNNQNEMICNDKSSVLMLSTNHFDKNNVEIFDGDVVMYKGIAAYIHYDGLSFMINNKPLTEMIIKSLKIISTVYDYPKILKQFNSGE